MPGSRAMSPGPTGRGKSVDSIGPKVCLCQSGQKINNPWGLKSWSFGGLSLLSSARFFGALLPGWIVVQVCTKSVSPFILARIMQQELLGSPLYVDAFSILLPQCGVLCCGKPDWAATDRPKQQGHLAGIS